MNLRIPPRVTDRAFRKIADSCESKILRVAVKGGGCSGFQYIFNIVDDVNENDQVFQKEESRVIIDNTSLQFLEGAKLITLMQPRHVDVARAFPSPLRSNRLADENSHL